MTRRQLLNTIQKAKSDIAKAPEGILKAIKHNGSIQFYVRKDKEDFNGKYLGKKDVAIARKLAQKEYACKILKEAENQLNVMDRFLKDSDAEFAQKVWEKFNPLKKGLVVPYEVSDKEFVSKWKALEYKGSETPFDKNRDYYSRDGVRVRSTQESAIASAFEKNGVPYRYEFPHVFKVDTGRGFEREFTVYSDFTVLNERTRKEYIWEHFGMMDHERYRRQAYNKIASYSENGYFLGENLIVTFGEDSAFLDMENVNRLIERYLK